MQHFISPQIQQKINQKISDKRSRNHHLLLAKQELFVDTLRQKETNQILCQEYSGRMLSMSRIPQEIDASTKRHAATQ